jgi:hypothetical protein
MITDRQLTETGMQLVLAHLTELLDPAYEMDDWIDKKLCEQHCPGPDCDRTDKTWPTELAGVKQAITNTVADLQDRIAVLAGDLDIEIEAKA